MFFTKRPGNLSSFCQYYEADKGGAGGGADDGKQDDGNGEEKKTYTQADIDKMFADRMKHTKSSVTTELLQALGVESLEAAQSIVKKQKEADDASKSELQKAQEEAAKAKEEALKLKQAQEGILAQANERLMQAEAMKLAVEYKDTNGVGFRPEAINDVWLVLDRSQVKADENGDFTGLKEAIETVAKARPHWLFDGKQAPAPRGTPGGKGLNQQNHQNQQNQQASNRRPFTL